jgi:hypothetical protein
MKKIFLLIFIFTFMPLNKSFGQSEIPISITEIRMENSSDPPTIPEDKNCREIFWAIVGTIYTALTGEVIYHVPDTGEGPYL